MRTNPLFWVLVVVACLLAVGEARAISTDIDTFSSNAAAPNIMILLDTSKSMERDSTGCGTCTEN